MIVLIVALIGIFAVLFTYGLSSVLAMEGSYPPNVLTDGLTPAPLTAEEAVDFLNKTVEKAMAEMPKTSENRHFVLHTDTIDTTGSDNLRDTFTFLAGAFDSQLDSNMQNGSADYSEDMTDIINIPAFSADDVTDFKCDYIYYSCPSCGKENSEPLDSCEACGGVNPYNMKYRSEYTVTLTLAVNDEAFGDNFTKRSTEEALALCGETLTETVRVDNVTIDYTELKVVYRVERLTNKLKYLEYAKRMAVEANAGMLGEYEPLGDLHIAFDITEYDSYSFTWPKISLSSHEMTVEPKGSDNLQATLTCSDPLNTIVTWTSSDENIVTVDEEGYFKAGKETGEAKIIASFDFNGQTYSDECVIKVKYSVESSKMKDKKITLKVGESKQLEVSVSPKDATVQTVTWYTDDESIAAVDENGVVTAAAAGTVTVYSLTDDGYFKSTCEVTVK